MCLRRFGSCHQRTSVKSPGTASCNRGLSIHTRSISLGLATSRQDQRGTISDLQTCPVRAVYVCVSWQPACVCTSLLQTSGSSSGWKILRLKGACCLNVRWRHRCAEVLLHQAVACHLPCCLPSHPKRLLGYPSMGNHDNRFELKNERRQKQYCHHFAYTGFALHSSVSRQDAAEECSCIMHVHAEVLFPHGYRCRDWYRPSSHWGRDRAAGHHTS